ncbi:extracellular matrix-binding protein ebh [Zerene cesonia]|uniref:extracellular matrix-binding protein ebh n=1 Tax=Zerene cesonia TaxID=33412 RepID=UPI0018E54ECA|nr:extracellular matrix-binding protein ebh [Zerene cesonia]
MSDVKQVKVDNWGIYFLQRLKHFFNRTDYCDLTLQFQDNAQLKVHRLVLNACTEYFEILERTCEMYEDCLVMPDDLQADVVVPIINFMYTGQLEFKMDLLEKLYQTSIIMNMPVLTKLLDSHRTKSSSTNLYGKRYSRNSESAKQSSTTASVNNSQPKKRTFSKAFENITEPQINKKPSLVSKADVVMYNSGVYNDSPVKTVIKDPKPTRYELPAELDDDNIFDNSFTSISYTSKPLMVHPETTKYYSPKKNRIFDEPSGSKRFLSGTTTMDIVECRKISSNEMFEDDMQDNILIDTEETSIKEKKDASQLFDQILINNGPKMSIETKNNKQANNLDHAKIISEVLKKYPHLVKSNKNIKLKILNTPTKSKKVEQKQRAKLDIPDFTYETDVVDSKEAARLIALGAENIKGPWICLICGTPGRALHFTSYYNYRRHLVEVHNEKPVSNICEYCGLKSLKRNYLLHHLYTKHDVEPPPNHNFPKCNICNYVALTDAFLAKHKLSHADSKHFRCTVCSSTFYTTKLLLQHIQKTGHKYSGEKKPAPQCIYCFKFFTRDNYLYAHLKANHYQAAKNDGIIDDSDEEKSYTKLNSESIKNEPSSKYIEVEIPNYDDSFGNTSYQLEQNADGNIEIMAKKPRVITPITKSKILNPGFSKLQTSNSNQKVNIIRNTGKNDFSQSLSQTKKEEIVLIDNNEYILQDFQLVPKQDKANASFMSDTYHTDPLEALPTITSTPEYSNAEQAKVILKKSSNINQPIQIVVSNEEEYKALLSSHHSIIFDNGDANKAMTVLTTPNTSVGNTIHLNNSQANDMMIIRENYPINITEANNSENSNIVVVYSHPVDDPNKHYQLITTSPSMEAQYVQPSAIITQNYETVTTTTPIIGSHEVINSATVDNSWQNETHDNTLPILKSSEIQIISHTDPSKVHQDNDTELNELPEVELAPQTVEQVHVPEPLPSSETIVTQSNEIVVDTEQNNISLTEIIPVSTFEPTPMISANTISSINNISEPMMVDSFKEVIDNIEQQPANIVEQQPANIVEQQSTISTDETGTPDISMVPVVEAQTLPPQSTVINTPLIETLSEPCDEQSTIRTEVIMEVQKVQSDSNVRHEQSTEKYEETCDTTENDNREDDEETIENIARVIGVDPDTLAPTENNKEPLNGEVIVEKPIVKEQIANLTSEWSEDETDTPPQTVNNTTEECNNIPQETENQEPEEITSTETEPVLPNNDNIEEKADESIAPQENSMPIIEETNFCETTTPKEIVTENTTVPQEKISSLLNDWEDNDSQDENNTEDITSIPTEVIKNTTDVVNETITAKADPKPDIRNLVSDWDEDDEEENKG